MEKTLTGKILKSHLVEGDLTPGSEIQIRIDQTLFHDATGTMTLLEFEAMGLKEVKTDLSAAYIDHNTQQIGFENSDDHLYLQTASARFGIVFSRAGNGICHQVHLERFGRPGTTLLGADSHTPTGGALGQLAIGAGGLDVAVAMGTGLYRLSCPRVYLVRLVGRLRPWATAKDVVLKMLSILSTKGNVGVILEYGGEGVRTLSVPQRATIANMGAEMGVTSSIFPSDQRTLSFLRAQGRESDWMELSADQDATYERIIELDLGDIEPLVATPHSPGNVKAINEVGPVPVDQVCIGSCTNSSYKDLMTAAAILKGKTVHPRVSLAVAPGSRQILLALAQNGALKDLIAAGARIKECACTFCIGNEFSPPSKGVSVRTSNRNYEGRSGTKDAMVYLTSVETAAACALTGRLTDPRELGISYPEVEEPEHYLISDNMFIFPGPQDGDTKILKGPNIGPPPRNERMPTDLQGEVVIKLGDNVTTDHITPAGPRLKYRSNIAKYSEFVFENIDPTFWKRCLGNKQQGIHNIIVAGESYGQGSSREHAAICPMYLGVKAIIAKSFERIHLANLVNFGLLPLIFEDPSSYDEIHQGDRLSARGWKDALAQGRPIEIINETRRTMIKCIYNLSAEQRRIIIEGGLLNWITKP